MDLPAWIGAAAAVAVAVFAGLTYLQARRERAGVKVSARHERNRYVFTLRTGRKLRHVDASVQSISAPDEDMSGLFRDTGLPLPELSPGPPGYSFAMISAWQIGPPFDVTVTWGTGIRRRSVTRRVNADL